MNWIGKSCAIMARRDTDRNGRTLSRPSDAGSAGERTGDAVARAAITAKTKVERRIFAGWRFGAIDKNTRNQVKGRQNVLVL